MSIRNEQKKNLKSKHVRIMIKTLVPHAQKPSTEVHYQTALTLNYFNLRKQSWRDLTSTNNSQLLPTLPTSSPFHLCIKMAWSGKNDSMPIGDNPRRLHVPVLAPPKPVSSELIPRAGPIAILPTDVVLAKSSLEYIKNGLSGIKGLQIQTGEEQVNEETRGIVWLDHSPGQIKVLEGLLTKYKGIGWIQLPMAGINAYSELTKKHPDKVWTSAKVSGRWCIWKNALG
jgi:hypothetical protein